MKLLKRKKQKLIIQNFLSIKFLSIKFPLETGKIYFKFPEMRIAASRPLPAEAVQFLDTGQVQLTGNLHWTNTILDMQLHE